MEIHCDLISKKKRENFAASVEIGDVVVRAVSEP